MGYYSGRREDDGDRSVGDVEGEADRLLSGNWDRLHPGFPHWQEGLEMRGAT